MPHSIVVPVIRRADYCVSIEQFDDTTLLHCVVRKWTTRVFRELREDFETLRRLHGGPFFVVDTDDPKLPKFLAKFGFIPHARCLDIDGNPRTMYTKD